MLVVLGGLASAQLKSHNTGASKKPDSGQGFSQTKESALAGAI
jgi:hypothetical protein